MCMGMVKSIHNKFTREAAMQMMQKWGHPHKTAEPKLLKKAIWITLSYSFSTAFLWQVLCVPAKPHFLIYCQRIPFYITYQRHEKCQGNENWQGGTDKVSHNHYEQNTKIPRSSWAFPSQELHPIGKCFLNKQLQKPSWIWNTTMIRKGYPSINVMTYLLPTCLIQFI